MISEKYIFQELICSTNSGLIWSLHSGHALRAMRFFATDVILHKSLVLTCTNWLESLCGGAEEKKKKKLIMVFFSALAVIWIGNIYAVTLNDIHFSVSVHIDWKAMERV